MPAGNQKVIGPIAPESKPQRASASQRRANPRDHTGLQKQKLEAQRADELDQREQELALAARAVRQARQDDVVDYSQGGHSSPSVVAENAPRVSEDVDETEVQEPVVEIRVSAPIEDMVFGREIVTATVHDEQGNPHEIQAGGNIQFYSFEEGRRYRVPRALADHLERLDYLVSRSS